MEKIKSNRVIRKRKKRELKEENARINEELLNSSVHKNENVAKNEEYSSSGTSIKIIFTFLLLAIISSVIMFFVYEHKKDDIFDEIEITEYLKLYESKEVEYIFITQDDCTYCELMKSNIDKIESENKINVNFINISNLNDEDKEILTSSNSAFRGNYTLPILLSIKDGKEISNLKGYKEYSVLKKFINNSSDPSKNTSFIKIGVDKYLDLLKSRDNTVIYIGRRDGGACDKFASILEQLSLEKEFKVNYLDTDSIDTENDWNKLNNSNKIFNKTWFVPAILIVKNEKIVDYKMEGMNKDSLLRFLNKNHI